jgi:phage repressor protein C with HTH and peptisase S24 domain
MPATAQRLEKAMQSKGLDQSGLARQIGVSQATINRIVQGKTANSRLLPRIATQLGVSLPWLLGMSDDMGEFQVASANDQDDDTVEVSALDVAYGMGGTYIDDNTVEIDKVKFSRSWLRNFTDAPPEMLFVARGVGDSMMPTIHDTDVVLVDRTERVVRMVDKIWAMSFGDIGMIKRLRPKPDGSMVILSDNASVPEDRAADGELHVVGRVCAIVRKV